MIAPFLDDSSRRRPEKNCSSAAGCVRRVAICNSRLIAANATAVTFKYKDYRIEGPARYKIMKLATHEFIRRFLMHVLPTGFHRIRHYGLFANTSRAKTIARARELLASAAPASEDTTRNPQPDKCPCCGGRMLTIEVFERGSQPHYRASNRRCVAAQQVVGF
jgi:hypothetical protein